MKHFFWLNPFIERNVCLNLNLNDYTFSASPNYTLALNIFAEPPNTYHIFLG